MNSPAQTAQFRPCIDLHGGKVKQIVGSTLNDDGAVTNFVAEHGADHFARLYRDDHLRGGHVIKLGPGNDEAARTALRAYPGGLQLGGGVTPENAKRWLDAGAAQVIVTSFIFSDGELKRDNLQKMLRAVGKERLVLDLSCRRRDGQYWIVTDLWRKFTRMTLSAALLDDLGASSAEFLIHAVDVEGKASGIDEELVAFLAANSPIDCVYAGGVRSLDDIRKIETHGKGRIHYTVGSALDLFGGALSYREIVDHFQTNQGVAL
ncbi:MAG: phosphoribosylformimino-5-aminoimidazole carboxamide ribotide isomerase [Victivallaceae bacterium]|nr:phosphoribosylformimino-5-aminoimidazole carboxamide ribotide isomerase [Victivallaceae bacterium]